MVSSEGETVIEDTGLVLVLLAVLAGSFGGVALALWASRHRALEKLERTTALHTRIFAEYEAAYAQIRRERDLLRSFIDPGKAEHSDAVSTYRDDELGSLGYEGAWPAALAVTDDA